MQSPVSMPIEHVDVQELALFISEKLPRHRADLIKAHVHICAECEERLVDGLLSKIGALNAEESAPHPVDHRTAKRAPSTGTGYVQSLSPLSFDRLPAQIVDSSDGGLGLLVTAPIAPGALIQICIGADVFLGEVRSSQTAPSGQFRLGVKVQSSAHLRNARPPA